jgi:pimeloyl-ACP methyl ester carboxylesterase
LVDVEGGQIHIYTEGEGEDTLVFLSGLGTSSPFYDFKPLYEKLSEENKIVVIERAGYGWSDITTSDRSLEVVLLESRKALASIGLEGPYTLIPHSLAGLEAIYWAQQFPDEVKMIVGLDPLVPDYYEQDVEQENPLSPLITFLARTGMMRQQKNVCENNLPVIQKGHLKSNEIDVIRTLFMRRVMTQNMWDEYRSLEENNQLVLDGPKLSVPFYTFISGKEKDIWIDTLKNYSDKSFILNADHYIHLDEPEFIADKITEFHLAGEDLL